MQKHFIHANTFELRKITFQIFGGSDSFMASDQTTVTNTLYGHGHMAMNTL